MNKKHRIKYFCIVGLNKFFNEYVNNRLKAGVNFRLIRNTRRRIHLAFNSESKSSSMIITLGIDIEIYRRWIDYQFTHEMNSKNIEFEHLRHISSFNISNHEELKELFL